MWELGLQRQSNWQFATFLNDLATYDKFLIHIKNEISLRLNGFYEGFQALKSEGHGVDAIAPEAAIYLTVKFDLIGKTWNGKVLESTPDVTKFILDEAKLAIVPFYAFGASTDSTWYRLSVGTCSVADVADAVTSLRTALQKLS